MMSSDVLSTVEYDAASGEILRTAYGMLDHEHASGVYPGGQHPNVVLSGVDPNTLSARTHYILDDQLTERPASPVSRTDLTLLDVPVGSTLWINGVSYPAEGTVDLEFTYPGTYSLRVECFPFLDWTDEVTVP